MTFAEQMVAKYETLLTNSAGLKTVNIDGQMVMYDDLERKYQFWKSKVAIDAGTKPRAAKINLGGF